MANVGNSYLQLLVVMGCADPSITVYPDWTTPDAEAQKVSPMFWDNVCPDSVPESLAKWASKPASGSATEL